MRRGEQRLSRFYARSTLISYDTTKKNMLDSLTPVKEDGYVEWLSFGCRQCFQRYT